MAQRDQIAGALGGEDPGGARGGQSIALRQSARCDHRDDFGGGAQGARRDGGASGGVLGGDVDHVCRAGLVQVRERRPVRARRSCLGRFGHYLLTTVIGCTYGTSSTGSGNVRSPNGDSAPVRSAASSLIA